MVITNPCLVVADPSLADARGHHFSLTMQITRGAQLQGIEVIWFTHKSFTGHTASNVRVYPIFSSTMYDRYRPDKKNNLSSDLDQKLLHELHQGIVLSDLGAEDHIYFHTGYGDLYRAISKYASSTNLRDKPFLHICTPYDLETMPGKDPGTALLDVFRSMRTIGAVDKKLFFWAETPQLAVHYTFTYGFNVRALPLPPPYDIQTSVSARKSDAVTALYLGAAREEKGFLLLPQIVESLYEAYGRTGQLQFVIQCSPQIIGYLPSIKSAIDKLASYPSSYVQLIDKVMDEQEYYKFLLASDVVLLLYNQKNYRIRGSGIAVEAVCASKSVLTHRGTFCASLITHGGGEAVDDVEEATVKLAGIVEARDKYRQMANIQGKQYCAMNSVERYVARIFAQTSISNAVPFFPSAIAGRVAPALLKIN